MKIVFNWKSKSTFDHPINEKVSTYVRYELICGKVIFRRNNLTGPHFIITEEEFSQLHEELEMIYCKLMANTVNNHHDISFR